MKRVRHKRKNNQVLIVASDAVDASVKQYKIRPHLLRGVTLVLCVLIGALIGYFIFEKDIWAERLKDEASQREAVKAIEQEKAELENRITELNEEVAGLNNKIAGLNEQIMILSTTVAQKTQSENELRQMIEKQSLPTEFPLTGRTTGMEEVTEGDPICIFTVVEGAMVVAAAKGTVIVVNDDPEYGHNVWVDHGNGYVTVYKNKGKVRVKQGETVSHGTTIFLIEADNNQLGYQMMKDGSYINPLEMLAIDG